MTDHKDARYDKDGHIATITLDRPDARNAYSHAMVDALMAYFDEAENDDDVRVLILTGAGRAFSAGGDLKLMLEKKGMFEGKPVQLRARYLQGIHQIPRRLSRFDKPIIAAINGAAIGAGLDLACMCDIRIAREGAKFGSTFVKVGLIPGDGGAYLLARTIGFPRALELMMTGRVITTDEALRIGLITEITTPEALLPRATAIAQTLAANAPLAVRMTKSAAYRSYDLNLEQALHLAATYQGVVQNSADHLEGVRSILEKREPEFVGE